MTTFFPRSVYTKDGRYTVHLGQQFEVQDIRVKRFASIVAAVRDLALAHEYIVGCCDDELDDLHPLLSQAMCTAAVINYAKPFTSNHAREPGRWLELDSLLKKESGGRHERLMTLRHGMFAHDQGISESKALSIYLPGTPPKSPLEIGVRGAPPRYVDLGSNWAKRFEPHFARALGLARELEGKAQGELCTELFETGFEGLVLLGPARTDIPSPDVF